MEGTGEYSASSNGRGLEVAPSEIESFVPSQGGVARTKKPVYAATHRPDGVFDSGEPLQPMTFINGGKPAEVAFNGQFVENTVQPQGYLTEHLMARLSHFRVYSQEPVCGHQGQTPFLTKQPQIYMVYLQQMNPPSQGGFIC